MAFKAEYHSTHSRGIGGVDDDEERKPKKPVVSNRDIPILHYCFIHNSSQIVDLLVKHDADPTIKVSI